MHFFFASAMAGASAIDLIPNTSNVYSRATFEGNTSIVHFLGAFDAPPPGHCATVADCAYNGQCEHGQCVCTPQFTGPKCDVFAFAPLSKVRFEILRELKTLPDGARLRRIDRVDRQVDRPRTSDSNPRQLGAIWLASVLLWST